MHLQRANWRRAVARQDLYRMQETLRWPDQDRSAVNLEYAGSLDESGAALHPVPAAWWAYDGLDRGAIDLAAEPWEAADCARLLARHGRGAFHGLSLAR